ncbi:MAG: tryptophan--tRNA ligase [Holosporales bacterium]
MGRILSGVKPSGSMTLGNYLGAIRQWVDLQHDHESFYCVVDLHALTVLQDPEVLRHNTYEVAATYLAAGLDPQKSAIFIQSHVQAHAELGWILGCFTPLGWLNRMTQFKDKAGKNRENANLGLYAYPVLMAADVLLYKATHVPVGEDQKQHLELARDICGAFNRHYECSVLVEPEPVIMGLAARVMSLRDGTKKMSKSDEGSDYGCIYLTDTADDIALKIRKAKTDPLPLPATLEELENRPEAKNLLSIYAALRGDSLEKTTATFAGAQFSTFKGQLSDLLIAKITPMGDHIKRLMADRTALDAILADGRARAERLAEATLHEVRSVMGLTRP